jgi:protein SMG6
VAYRDLQPLNRLPALPLHHQQIIEMRGNSTRHLVFNHLKDDPVRFSVMPRPQLSAPGRPSHTPKYSRDYVSTSSNSSYAASISSSAFTLFHPQQTSHPPLHPSSKTKSKPSRKRCLHPPIEKVTPRNLKLETKVKQEDSMDDADYVMSSRVMLKGSKEFENDDLEKARGNK